MMLSNNDELNQLWQKAKRLMNSLSPEELREMDRISAISFVYGNLKLSGWTGTKDDVEREYERMYGQRGSILEAC